MKRNIKAVNPPEKLPFALVQEGDSLVQVLEAEVKPSNAGEGAEAADGSRWATAIAGLKGLVDGAGFLPFEVPAQVLCAGPELDQETRLYAADELAAWASYLQSALNACVGLLHHMDALFAYRDVVRVEDSEDEGPEMVARLGSVMLSHAEMAHVALDRLIKILQDAMANGVPDALDDVGHDVRLLATELCYYAAAVPQTQHLSQQGILTALNESIVEELVHCDRICGTEADQAKLARHQQQLLSERREFADRSASE